MKTFPNLKYVIITVLCFVCTYIIYAKYHEFEKLENELKIAIAQRDAVVVQRDKAVAVVRANDLVIEQLKQDKEDVNEALKSLSLAQQANEKNTAAREVIIQQQASKPANAVEAAPVLLDVIAEIEKDRIARRK